MAQFEIVFWANDTEKGTLEVEADYYRDIESNGQTEFILGPTKPGSTNIVLRIDTEEIFYILKKSDEPSVDVSQLGKFYKRYPQAVGA